MAEEGNDPLSDRRQMDGRNTGLCREGRAVQRWIYWMIIPFQASTVAIKIKMSVLMKRLNEQKMHLQLYDARVEADF